MGSCGVFCMKALTFSFNLLFAITGAAIFSIGLIVQLKYTHFSNFVSDHTWTAPIILMIVGLSIATICFLGCCGVIKENRYMVCTFVLLAGIILACEIGVGIAAYVKHSDLKPIMEHQFNNSLTQYNERKDIQDAWNLMQSELECCGTYVPNDWDIVFQNGSLPSSCCTVIPINETHECSVEYAHSEGCLKKLFYIIDSKTLQLLGIVFGVAAVQLITIAFACCLCRSYNRNYENV